MISNLRNDYFGKKLSYETFDFDSLPAELQEKIIDGEPELTLNLAMTCKLKMTELINPLFVGCGESYRETILFIEQAKALGRTPDQILALSRHLSVSAAAPHNLELLENAALFNRREIKACSKNLLDFLVATPVLLFLFSNKGSILGDSLDASLPLSFNLTDQKFVFNEIGFCRSLTNFELCILKFFGEIGNDQGYGISVLQKLFISQANLAGELLQMSCTTVDNNQKALELRMQGVDALKLYEFVRQFLPKSINGRLVDGPFFMSIAK